MLEIKCIVLFTERFDNDHLNFETDRIEKTFENEAEARKFIESIQNNWRFTDIIGPLKLITERKEND